MKVRFQRRELQSVLQQAKSFLPQKSYLAALQGFLVRAQKGAVTIEATNKYVWGRWRLSEVEVIKEGETIVSEHLATLAGAADCETLLLEQKVGVGRATVWLEGKEGTFYRLPVMSVDDFPTFVPPEGGVTASVDGAQFLEAVKKVQAAGKRFRDTLTYRTVLYGLNLQGKEGSSALSVAATEGRLLLWTQVPTLTPLAADFNVSVLLGHLSMLPKADRYTIVAPAQKGNAKSQYLYFRAADERWEVLLPLLTNSFPAYEHLLQITPLLEIVLDVSAVKQAMKRLLAVARVSGPLWERPRYRLVLKLPQGAPAESVVWALEELERYDWVTIGKIAMKAEVRAKEGAIPQVALSPMLWKEAVDAATPTEQLVIGLRTPTEPVKVQQGETFVALLQPLAVFDSPDEGAEEND